MAIIYSYPLISELATGDTIAISDASNGNKTKSVTVGQLNSYMNTGQATIVQVDDRVVTAASFGSSTGVLTLTRNSGDIPAVTANLDGRYALTTSLATVATSGSYNDLSDKPTIPTSNLISTTITLTPAQVLSLSGGGSNLELIAAPGADKVIDVVSILAYLDFGTQSYNWIGTGNKLSITTTTPVSQENGFNLAVTQLNASADTYWKPEIANPPIGVNLPLSIYNTSGSIASQGDSPITFNILYQIVNF